MIPGVTTNDGKIDITSPYDQNLIATADTADYAAIELALKTAYQLYQNRQTWLSTDKRLEILNKTAEIMTQQAEILAIDAAREGGKPLIDSKIEVARAIDGIRICIETIRTQSGKTIPMNINAASSGKLAFSSKEPIGVVVAVSAFNHPLNLIVHQVAPAIATGCPVIVKPAEDTPISCFRFVNILQQAGLPASWCQALVVNDLNVASKLVTDQRVAFFSFIGSAKVGWMLRSKIAPGTRCALEHGGAAPVIVNDDANLKSALPKLLKAGLYHAGQVCVSVQRIYAHASIARSLAEKLAEQAKMLKVGDPTLAETDIGPLIRPAEVKRVHEWVHEAIHEGAELLTGGKILSDSCYDCTVLYNPTPDAKVNTLEIFGPVICVNPFTDIDDAISEANKLPFAFQSSIFTQNIDTAMYAFKRLASSAVMINEHTAFRVDWMPFAGLKQSGLGIGGIPYSISDMQVDKMMVISSPNLM